MRSRLERAIDRLDDAEDDHDKWAFGRSPSENRADFRRIQKLRAKVERLRAKSQADS